MKRSSIVALIFLAVGAATALSAVAVFALRPQAYLGTVRDSLGGAFGASAEIGRIGWTGPLISPGLELASVSLKRPDQPAEPGPDATAFFAEKVRMAIDLPALFRRRILIHSVQLWNPRMHLVRDEDGLRSGGVPLDGSGWKSAPGAWRGVDLRIERIGVTGGTLEYEDVSGQKPRRALLSALDLDTRPPSSGQPVRFEAKAGFLTKLPNASFEGSFLKDPKTTGWSAALTKVRMGLDQITVRSLETAFPELEGLGLRGRFEGALSGSVEKIVHDGTRLLELDGRLKLEGIKCFVRAFKSPLQDLNADLFFDRDTLILSQVDGRIAGGEFLAHAEVRNLDKSDPDASFDLRADRISLGALFPRPAGGRAQLMGQASIEVRGTVQGRTQTQQLASLDGTGHVVLSDGWLMNLNVLRLIFDKLAASIPGAAETFARTMPQELSMQLSRNDTALAPLDVPFQIGRGGVAYPSFRIAGEGFEINGAGQQGFGGDISFRTIITLDPRISSYLMAVYPDLASAADSYGRLSLPVLIAGTTRNIRVQPDTQYLIGRILGVRGVELIRKLI